MGAPNIHLRGYWTTREEGHRFDPWLAKALAALFVGRSVCDFGCGPGKYVDAMRRSGLACDGIDGNPNTEAMTSGTCGVADLSQPLALPRKYDFALSLEVGEHIPRPFEDVFLANLVGHAERGIVLSWAVPEQPGDGHVNNRSNAYVVRKLRGLGYRLDRPRTRGLRRACSLPWFKKTLLVFVRHDTPAPFASDPTTTKPLSALFAAFSGIAFRVSTLFTRQNILRILGGRDVHWTRIVMNAETEKFVAALGPQAMDVAEISGNKWATFGFRSYEMLAFPQFDVTGDQMPERRYDMVILEQVLEHVRKPAKALRNVHGLLKDGGWVVVTTPFLLKVHLEPEDHSRWTETGLRNLLEDAGFSEERITTGSWGNRSCVKANFRGWWPYIPWLHSLRNEKSFPTVVWAFAQRSRAR